MLQDGGGVALATIDLEKLFRSVSIENVAASLGMELRPESPTKFMALCPFHKDKNPSLLIDSSRERGLQHFHCFACGEHGDVIDLVKQRLGLDFLDAANWLANTSGVSIAARGQPSKRPTPVRFGSGFQIGLELYERSGEAERLKAWAEARGHQIGALMSAGFAFARRGALSRALSAIPDSSERRENAGHLTDVNLIRKAIPGLEDSIHLQLVREGGATYVDYFRGDRVIFPIRYQDGALAGLGGRLVPNSTDPGTWPKYQFTKNLPKSQILYRADWAFARAKELAQRSNAKVDLYICEGFLDVLRLESLGLLAVAVMGNSISKDQVAQLKELSDGLPSKGSTLRLVVCFDRDEAGLRGASAASIKLLAESLDVVFVWPTDAQLGNVSGSTNGKDPDEYLAGLLPDVATGLLAAATHTALVAVLANQFGTDAGEMLDPDAWQEAPRSRVFRAFDRARLELKKAVSINADSLKRIAASARGSAATSSAFTQWSEYLLAERSERTARYSEVFLTSNEARLNHSRLLAYKGSRRGELPCDEPRWERLDIAATAFNVLVTERLARTPHEPVGPYDAVWVPRSFGGSEPRLKIMPRPEDLVIQQYLLNELLTERWDQDSVKSIAFSRCIPAVRYYREERRTVTTGLSDHRDPSALLEEEQVLSFAYQIDMDVLEGRQPATDQGMYRPFSDCWRDFMSSIKRQASEMRFVYALRLDVSRYYDRLRRFVVRDCLVGKVEQALLSVAGDSVEFGALLGVSSSISAAEKAAAVLDRLSDHLFDVPHVHPATGVEQRSARLVGIPQGPVLSEPAPLV